MRNYLLLFIALFFSSCEKVLDLHLGNTEPKVVIESIFTNQSQRHVVSISYTSDFEANNAKIPVVDAVVTLKEENGPTLTFTQLTPGNYSSNRYRGVPGRKYTLSVTVKGVTYIASSTMPMPVDITSLSQSELSFFGERRKVVQLNYKDPIGIPNFYFNRVFVNGVRRDNFSLESDRFNDGKDVKNTIYIDEPDLITNDVVRIQMLTIDENVYRYLFSITQITGNGGPPTTPANPTSNFNNGALGYFSASTSTEQTITIE